MSGMLSSPVLGVPSLSIETSPSELKVRVGRQRSSSIVKVETVGENSQEEGLDQSVYDNVNAEWVNRKGKCIPRFLSLSLPKSTNTEPFESFIYDQAHGSYTQYLSSLERS